MKIKNILSIFKSQQNHLLGIEIKQDFIRAVELSYIDGNYRVEYCANKTLSDYCCPGNNYEDLIKATLKKLSAHTRFTSLALSHAEVVFKEFDVADGLSYKELDSFLRFRLQEHYGETKKLNLDYQVIKCGDMKRVRLVAAQKEHIDAQKEMLKSVGFVLQFIDIDVYAVRRAVLFQLENFMGSVAVINMSYGDLFIEVLNGRDVVYVHKEFISGEGFKVAAHVLELLDPKLKIACSSLTKPLDRIVLAGEVALLPGVVELLRVNLKLPVIIANPFLRMKRSSKISAQELNKVSSLMLVSCGLALRVSDSGR